MANAKSPLSLGQQFLYEKPERNADFYSNSYKDGYAINGNEARLGKGRLDWLISEYGVWDDDSDYSNAFLAYVDPREFINGTTSSNNDSHIRKEIGEQVLDLDRLNNETQTPFLDVDFSTNQIVGHEGRHRMGALANAGVFKVPVVIRDKSPKFKKYQTKPHSYNGKLKGQSFGDDSRLGSMKWSTDLIPLNYKNAPLLWEKFGYKK